MSGWNGWIANANLVCCLLNAGVAFWSARRAARLKRLYQALLYLCLSNLKLRHVTRAQVYGLMTVIEKEDLLKQ
jgi:hypothetical protein